MNEMTNVEIEEFCRECRGTSGPCYKRVWLVVDCPALRAANDLILKRERMTNKNANSNVTEG